MTASLIDFVIALVIAVVIFFGLKNKFLALWRRTPTRQSLQRTALILAAAAILASPFVAVGLYSRNVMSVNEASRIPKPLVAWRVEYRLEESWGFGPGGNETGFAVYLLTGSSTKWARRQGDRLGQALSGRGALEWRPTPVDDVGDRKDWHRYDDDPSMTLRTGPHPATVAEYLEKYGFTIPIEDGKTAEADLAIRSTGAVYAYGPGGSVTIVDPARGKIFFFYAG